MSTDPLRLGYAPPSSQVASVRFLAGRSERMTACVAEEIPAAVSYNGVVHAVMMVSPADLEDFATGFSLTEGVVGTAAELTALAVVRHARGIELHLETSSEAAAAALARSRSLPGRTGCGLCGQQSLAQAIRPLPTNASTAAFTASAIARAMSALASRQPLNALTGAVHAAGWADGDGVLHLVREDVGRHNALDKLVGAMARAGSDASAGFVVVTSRASYEMVQKAATLGAPLLAAVSAPTMLAIQVADRAGMALAGFAREQRVTVYAHAERVVHGDRAARPLPEISNT